VLAIGKYFGQVLCLQEGWNFFKSYHPQLQEQGYAENICYGETL
jgi:hypothetical protein